MSTTTPSLLDVHVLREALATTLPEFVQGEAAAASLSCHPFERSTWHATYVVTIRSESGAVLRVFLKDFGNSARVKEGSDQRRERERRVYRDVLASANLGTARYFGSVWSPPAERFWLLLEFVDGRPVSDCAFDSWVEGARWLGRMHGHFAGELDRLKTYGWLVAHDFSWFWSKALRAERAVADVCPAEAPALARALHGYERDAELMGAQMVTLTHGAYRPAEILIGEQGRVCPVDWELAGIGSPLYDFAALSDGFETPRLNTLWEAYTSAAVPTPLSLPAVHDLREALRPFQAHRIMTWLSQSQERSFSRETISGLVRKLAALQSSQPVSRSTHGTGIATTDSLDAATLQTAVQELLARVRGHDVRVTTLARTPNPRATVFPSAIVQVLLDDGTQSSLFVKSCGSEERDHPDKQVREREIHAYEELFAGAPLPVAVFYGWRRDESGERLHLFFEPANGMTLDHHELDCWFEAVESLGRLHAWFDERPGDLLKCTSLLRFETPWFLAWSQRAVECTAAASSELARRLKHVVSRYEQVAGLLAAQPMTLVHNDLAPQNVIVDRTADPMRVCFVDWELAGAGCGLLDLVHLTYGFDTATGARLRDAYVEARRAAGGRQDLETAVYAAGLHKTLYRLARATVRRASLKKREQWVREAEVLLSQL